MPGETVITQERPHWERQRWWGVWALHLPPAGYIVGASLLGGLLSSWSIRSFSGVVDITLRLDWVIRVLGFFPLLSAYFSGWRSSGPFWVRWASRVIVLASLVIAISLAAMGEKAPLVLVDAAIGLLFASLPLHLRRVRLTESWMNGSLRPAILASLTTFAFVPVLGLLNLYQSLCVVRAQSTLDDLKALTAGLTQLAERGTLSDDELKSLQALSRGLPSNASLWLSLSVMPPKEARRRQGEIEEAVTGLLTATQNLYLSPPSFVNAAKIAGSFDDKNNQERFVKVRAYWEQVRQIVGEGELLASFLADDASPTGLSPNPKLKPQATDAVGRVALFRSDVRSQVEGLLAAFSAFDNDLTRFAEASAAIAMLRSYPDESINVPIAQSMMPDPFQVDQWGRLRFNGVAIFQFWDLFAIPESRLREDARCVKEKLTENKKTINAYICSAYDVSQKEVASAFIGRVIFRYAAEQEATPNAIAFEARKPGDIVSWKKSILDALKQRSLIVTAQSAGGFKLSSSDSKQETLLLQFEPRPEVARFKIERAPTK